MTAGKKKRSLRRWKRRCRHLQGLRESISRSPFPTCLVGYDGKMTFKRLHPNTRSRADKLWEEKLKQEHEEQCYRLERQITYHEKLLQQIDALSSSESERSRDLYQELRVLEERSRRLLGYLLKKSQPTPEFLGRLKILLNEDDSRDAKQDRRSAGSESSSAELKHSESNARTFPPLQLFVYGVPNNSILILHELYSDSTGKELVTAISRACKRRLPSDCSIVHGTKNVTFSKTLKEQGIQNESNIHVAFKLLGGMDAQNHTSDVKDDDRVNASAWNRSMVASWLDDICKTYEIDIAFVGNLKTLNGAGLSELQKEDWIRRCPEQGDFLYGKWKSLIEMPSRTRQGESTETNEERTQIEIEPSSEQQNYANASSLISSASLHLAGKFEEIQDMEDIKASTIDELVHSSPEIGTVIAVDGLCASRPRRVGGAGSLHLRNDPEKGQQFYLLKVDFRCCDLLSKHKMSDILNIKLSEKMAISGRVEKLEENYTSPKKDFKMLPYKIVVDSDDHGAVRSASKSHTSFLRQLSTPWHIQCGLYPAEDPTTCQPLNLGDVFKRDRKSIFLPPGSNKEKIKECAVALRNSCTGDIFVGIENDGTIVGERIKQQKVIQEREDLSKAIATILPCVHSEVYICKDADDALEKNAKNKSFISFMFLKGDDADDEQLEEPEEETVAVLVQVHIVQGSRPVHFVKPSDIHAYVRVGTETKEMSDFEDFYQRLDSLSWRNVTCDQKEVEDEIKKASKSAKHESINVFKRFKFESEDREFKAVYGNAKKIISEKYVAKYAAGFLNGNGGEIYFGVTEDSSTKAGYATGVILSEEERKYLLEDTATRICNFWPPVESSQFLMTFINITTESITEKVLTYPKTDVENDGKAILLKLSPNDIPKAQNIVRDVLKTESIVSSFLRLSDNCYCILSQKSDINVEEFVHELQGKLKQTKCVCLDSLSIESLRHSVKDACIVRLRVDKSRYPIHLTHPLLTYVLDKDGEVREMTCEELITKLQSRIRKDNFNAETFLKTLNNFHVAQSSYVLMTASFNLKEGDRDLVGLVVPEWTMVLDFDQQLKSDGHLFNIFHPLHDEHQAERKLSLKTPCDRKLYINPSNGVCWYAVRGYEELGDTLSEEGHGNWNMQHGVKVKSHLKEELVYQVNPNHLYLVCLYNEGQEEILSSMHMLVEHILSLWSKTTVVFVCPDAESKRSLEDGLIHLLERDYNKYIKRENVYVVPVDHLSKYLSVELQPTFRPESAFQVPKRYVHGLSENVPEALRQDIRQSIQGRLQMMYLGTGCFVQEHQIKEDQRKLFSGSAIGNIGLAKDLGIKRDKLEVMAKELKVMLEDKKSHVSMVVLKAERGSGATTLCRQLLYRFHKKYPCAQLIDFHKDLVTNMDQINKHTNLPLIVFVDSDIANIQDFTDLVNEAEIRKIHAVFVIVDSEVLLNAEGKSAVKRKRKSTSPYFTGTAPRREVELSRELTLGEMERLVEELRKTEFLTQEKEGKLLKLKEDAFKDRTLRKFAYFSLTVFGKNFSRLEDYVSYRINQTSKTQTEILDFLALTHNFTECYFPVAALSEMLKENRIVLDVIFNNTDVLELLSPASGKKQKDGRRISFREVAEEILQQRASRENVEYVEFLKTTALNLAKQVLSRREPSKKIQRLNKRLFFTSEYEHDKYSPLIRCMKDAKIDTACSTLEELTDIFSGDTPRWAHLQAHLAKFYMQEYGRYEDAMKCITDAIKEQENDILLQHIHGDIIRLQIKNLSNLGTKNINVDNMIKLAIKSSSCFEKVREKRPHQEHGYTSDVLVRQILMEAVSSSSALKYPQALCQRIVVTSTSPLRMEDKYLLSLIPEVLGLLQDIELNDHTHQLKKSIVKKMGSKEEIETLCNKMTVSYPESSEDGAWMKDCAERTMLAFKVTSLETMSATSDQYSVAVQDILKQMLPYVKTYDERSMKMWIHYIRYLPKVPTLNDVCEKVNKWYQESDKKSRFAAFYKYVTDLLQALRNPKDTDRMKAVGKNMESIRRKQYSKKEYMRMRSEGLPFRLEWLHPKEGHHITSIDCLLNDTDLMKGYVKGDDKAPQSSQISRDIVERALFERNIARWEGVVASVETDLKGTIYMKNYIPVHFAPSHVEPVSPESGVNVTFYLSFDWNGPHAWKVVCPASEQKRKKSLNVRPAESSDEEESESEGEDGDLNLLTPLYKAPASRAIPRITDPWEPFKGMEIQGVVVFVADSEEFGKIKTTTVEDELFFHKSALLSLRMNDALLTPVVCKVDQGRSGWKAVNILKLQVEELSEETGELLHLLTKERSKSPPGSKSSKARRNRRLEGTVAQLLPCESNTKTHGFIDVDKNLESDPSRAFFHVRASGVGYDEMKKIEVGSKVQFRIDKDDKGFIAKEIYVQHASEVAKQKGQHIECSPSCGWEKFVGSRNPMNGVISFLKSNYGFITNEEIVPNCRLYFQNDRMINLYCGMKVSFIVGHNGRTCCAKGINTHQKEQIQPFPTPPQIQLPPRPFPPSMAYPAMGMPPPFTTMSSPTSAPEGWSVVSFSRHGRHGQRH